MALCEHSGYVRVSSKKHADGGVSPDAPTQKIHAMAVAQGADLVDILMDAGASAGWQSGASAPLWT